MLKKLLLSLATASAFAVHTHAVPMLEADLEQVGPFGWHYTLDLTATDIPGPIQEYFLDATSFGANPVHVFGIVDDTPGSPFHWGVHTTSLTYLGPSGLVLLQGETYEINQPRNPTDRPIPDAGATFATLALAVGSLMGARKLTA